MSQIFVTKLSYGFGRKALFTHNVCVYVIIQEWVLWLQVIVFTRNIWIFKNEMGKIKEKYKPRRYVSMDFKLNARGLENGKGKDVFKQNPSNVVFSFHPHICFNQPASPFNIYSDYEITYLSIIVSSCFEKSFRFITVTTRWPGYPGNPFPPEKLRQEVLHYSKQIRGEFLASLICDLRLRFNIPQQLLLL